MHQHTMKLLGKGHSMNSGLKKILANKNTVTVVGIVAVVFILYFAYNWRINQAITPVSVPYARELIKAGTQITQDKIGMTEVPSSMVNGGKIITNVSAYNVWRYYKELLYT